MPQALAALEAVEEEPPKTAQAPTPAPVPATLDGGSNRPLSLEAPDEAWVIEDGYVDLFAVTAASGQAPGDRHHLLRAEVGMCLFGAAPDPAGAGLLAVGSLGSRLRRAAAPAGEVAAADPLAVEAWVGRMTRAAMGGEGDWPQRVLEPGPQRLEAASHAAADPRRLLWVTPLEGEVAWLGTEPLATGLAVPLAAPGWVAAGTEAGLAVSETPPAADRLGPALAAFDRLVLERVVARRAREREAEQRRLAESHAATAEGMAEALGALAGIAGGRADATPLRRGGGLAGDALAQALERVCAASGHATELPRPRAEPDGVADAGGERLARLLAAARLRARPVVLDGNWWRSDGSPVLGWLGDERRPVALLPTGRGRWRAVGRGVDAPVDAALAGAVAHDATQVYPALPARPVSLRALAAFGRAGSGADLRRVVAMGAAGALAALLLPVSAALLFDTVVPLGDRSGLAQIAAGLVAAALGQAAFEMVRALSVLRLEARLDARLQAAVMDRLLRLPVRFFRSYSTGDLMERTLGLQEARELLTGSTVTGLFGAVFGLASLGLLAALDWRLAAVALCLVVAIAAVTAGLSWGQLRHERRRARAKGRVDGFVLQLIVGIAKLRTAAAEPRALAEWAWRSVEQRRAFVAARRYVALQEVAQALLPTLSLLAVYATVAHLVEADARREALDALVPTFRGGGAEPFSTGSFIAFSAAFGQLTAALTATATALTEILAAAPLLERTRPLLEAVPETPPQAEARGRLRGRVELRRVSFRYAADAPLALRDVSLAIEPGEFVAIVGSSGSGKSTIMRLLLGFERPEAGDVLYDGLSAERTDHAALRRDIGVVLQNGRITAGSILDNIVGTSSRLTLDDAWAAARLVNLDADVEAMPMGMHTVLADGGGTLSGGQRQRVLLARALVRRPRILLLDEATSALDNRTQAVVTATLARLSITRVVIAHRLSTVRDVDRILVLEQGRLAQSGGYEELARQSGAFAELVRRQLL